MARQSRRLIYTIILCAVLAISAIWSACEDLEVADFNSEFRPLPTVKRAPTIQTAPTIAAAPTITKFEASNEGNPCETYLENPMPNNAQQAAEWAVGYLEAAGHQVDPEDAIQVTAACQAALNR